MQQNNTAILDNSLLQSDDTRGCTYTITTWTSWWWAGL